MLNIIKDQSLIEHVYEYDVILVGTSIMNALGNGFQYQVKVNFPEVEKSNKKTKYGDHRKLGNVTVVNTNPIFCLLFINKGGYRTDLNPDYLDYEALESCMKLINENFKGKKIASTIIGSSEYEGNGDQDKIMEILETNSSNIELTLYDFQQEDRLKERDGRWKKIVNTIGKVTTEEYQNMKKDFFWRNAFGIYKPMPEGLSLYELKQYIVKEKGTIK